MTSRKELQEKFNTWAKVAGFRLVNDGAGPFVYLEHRSSVYGKATWRIVVVHHRHGGRSTPFHHYMTAGEMMLALSLAISTVYNQTALPELMDKEEGR